MAGACVRGGGARLAARGLAPWLALWAAASALVGVALAQAALADLREAFDVDARIAHRLLSQRAAQHDAVLGTLTLLQADAAAGAPAGAAAQRLPALYPQVVAVRLRGRGDAWNDAALEAAEERSRRERHAVVAEAGLEAGRVTLVQAADPTSAALVIDLARMVPWPEWPATGGRPLAATLARGGSAFDLRAPAGEGGAEAGAGTGAGEAATAASPQGWTFEARKTLASDSQPFELTARRHVGWAALPWGRMAGAAVLLAVLTAALRAARQQAAARRRAEELVRLGQVARLNALGELAAGMAHELNQPLTAVLASTQAARRLLAEEPPDLAVSRQALDHASAQAQRASEVLARLRRTVERPDRADQVREVALGTVVRETLHLLEPECRRLGVAVQVSDDGATRVQADPVALQQIVHNLLTNALQALERGGAARRELHLAVAAREGQALLQVADSGPGIAPEALPRLFQPFFTTREGGLGLGLSLSETLAAGMGGRLVAANRREGGAQFELTLPLASPQAT